MIGIDERVAAGADCLLGRKLGAGTDGEDGFGQHGALKDAFVEVASQFVDVVLPQVADGCQCAADVAVEGGIADGELGFIGITGEGAAKGCCQACHDAGAAVA